MDEATILSIISAELSGSDEITQGLEDPLNYYLGAPNGLEVEGRSQVTSTDVADAIEWIMPQIMKSFTQSNEVVRFDPVHEGDERQAEIESDYVCDVVMKQNNGFIAIHQFVKDALLQNNGLWKIYYEDSIKETVIPYTGIPVEHLGAILSDDSIEVLEYAEREEFTQYGQLAEVVDVKLKRTHKNGRVVIESIPREQFRVNNDHNSICLDSARFTAHVMSKTRSELISGGYDPEVVAALPTSSNSDSDYRHSAQGDNAEHDVSLDESQEEVDIAECYIVMDKDGNGVAELVKVTAAGGDSPTEILGMEVIPSSPWVGTTAILMSHKFKGLSIFDRLKQIQDQKTSLWRNMFDNLYLQNNQRTVVVENQVELDDLLVSRPGGIIRAKRLDAVQPLLTPSIGDSAQRMMGYLDEVRAGRVGVSAEGAASPQNIGDRVGSQGLDRLMTAKEELVGLIIRVIAETGLKPAYIKVRDLLSTHSDSIKDYKFRGEWVKISPASWVNRTACTVRVGTGTGDRDRQVSAVREVMAFQEKILGNPNQSLVSEQKVFDTLDDFCRFSGLNGASRYYIDPQSEEGKAKAKQVSDSSAEKSKKEDALQESLMTTQSQLATAEIGKARASMEGVNAKAESDTAKNQLALIKQSHEAEIKNLKLQLDEAKLFTDSEARMAELELRAEEMDRRFAIELTRIEKEGEQTDENKNYDSNKDSISE